MTYYKACGDNYGNLRVRSATEIGGPWQDDATSCRPVDPYNGHYQTATQCVSEVGEALSRLEKEQSVLEENVRLLRARLTGALMPENATNGGWGAEEPMPETSELVQILRRRTNDTVRLKNEVATIISLLTL